MIHHLTPSLIGVTVPKDAKPDISTVNGINWLNECEFRDPILQLPPGNWSIVGEVERDRMGFDPEPFVEFRILDEDGWGFYRDYTNVESYTFDTSQESFYSLLASKGLYWTNPLKALEPYIMKGSENSLSLDEYKAWQEAESKKMTEETKIIILKSIKTMAKFRKKPVVIEAVQWTGENLKEIIDFSGPQELANKWTWEEYENTVKKYGLKIFTLEGPLMASINDWIIKGVNGEFYPCKPDIFEKTYEKID